MKNTEKHKLTIGSIRYVYDEQAASKWFDLYVELVKEYIVNNESKNVGQAYIQYKGSDVNDS